MNGEAVMPVPVVPEALSCSDTTSNSVVLPSMPILEVETPLSIFHVLVEHLPRDIVLDDMVQLCQNFEDTNELYEIKIFLNANRPIGQNAEFALISFTTSNGLRKAIAALNDLTLSTNLETKSLRARIPRKGLDLTLDGPFPRHNGVENIKKTLKSISGYQTSMSFILCLILIFSF